MSWYAGHVFKLKLIIVDELSIGQTAVDIMSVDEMTLDETKDNEIIEVHIIAFKMFRMK